MRIVLSRFLSTRHIQHTDATDCTEALRKLVESQQGNEDAVTYQKTTIFKLNEMDPTHTVRQINPLWGLGCPLNVDQDGNLYFETSVNRDGDIVDTFSFNQSNYSTRIKVTFFIGRDEYSHSQVDEIVIAAAAYEDFAIRVTFLQTPRQDEEIELRSRYYMFHNQDRQLLKRAIVDTRNFFYGSGMCCYKNDVKHQNLPI